MELYSVSLRERLNIMMILIFFSKLILKSNDIEVKTKEICMESDKLMLKFIVINSQENLEIWKKNHGGGEDSLRLL